jgi:aminoglycoside phosphotransferase (APT) family kinase protein
VATGAAGGDALLHFDVRSDNICIRDGRAVLVDWNFARAGNPLATSRPGSQPPGRRRAGAGGDRARRAAELAALLAGYFGAHAARPEIPEAPHVRTLQLRQARTALPWAARALGLPPPR